MTSISLFSTDLDDQQDNLYKTVKILRDLTEANRRKSKAKPNYSWRAPPFVEPLKTKIILIIFTPVNDCPNLTHGLLMAFSDLEKRKHRSFLEKHNAGARANIK